jgi:hypothetical protein
MVPEMVWALASEQKSLTDTNRRSKRRTDPWLRDMAKTLLL